MKKFNLLDTIVSPVITEKATTLSEFNKMVFRVHKGASKNSIKKSIEKIFKVNVIKINTINLKGKTKLVKGKKSSRPGYKKAIVTLKKGQSIDLATGI
ncbi:MAG: 50S ribosomal protein L23 [Alphaproteobacteria bacterium]|jgi:large subunit ribosomal protein L23|nr:MAG: 50S ribosomal protein L23 [Alphaproteobacteria bacterium]RUA19495.1 MAG: 50S ribosomal protein L23 [Alphaproteobacteria bacterium]HIN07436.1 50S ribosomal protein L23 [Pelagibacteraceae bacterium]|tara:strand:- start:97 stop:390 length:294 start_codon:yes stop_codon:yes gene_type:complete